MVTPCRRSWWRVRVPAGSPPPVTERRSALAGFSLAEVLASLVLLALAATGVAAGGHWAARRLSQAELVEGAALVAGEVLDSLAQASSPVSGERRSGALEIAWDVAGGGSLRRIELRFLEPPELRGEPPLVLLLAPAPEPFVGGPASEGGGTEGP